MYQYVVKIIIDSEEEYTKKDLREMLEDNLMQDVDSAPFDITMGEIEFGVTS